MWLARALHIFPYGNDMNVPFCPDQYIYSDLCYSLFFKIHNVKVNVKECHGILPALGGGLGFRNRGFMIKFCFTVKIRMVERCVRDTHGFW